MTAFISAGHNAKAKIKPDPGAIGVNGQKEGDLTIEFRDLVVNHLNRIGVRYITDDDQETLAMYLSRIQSGPGSVVLEFHFDAAVTPNAVGCSALVGADADRLDKAFATELVLATSKILGIRSRGVISEADSHRGRLGLMREKGTVALLELCFITNPNDMASYHKNKFILAPEIAKIIKKYEDFVP